MAGRPSTFTQFLGDQICERLVAGDSLRKICKRPGFPDVSTVCRWLAHPDHVAFREQYALAREAQADTLADEIIYLADRPKVGSVVTTKEIMVGDEKGTETRTKRGDMLGHRRLQIDARRWYAAKLAPKKYGDKLDLTAAVAIKFPSSNIMGDEDWAKEFGAQG